MFIYQYHHSSSMTKQPINIGISVAKTLFKISIVSLFAGVFLLGYTLTSVDVRGNYYVIDAQQTLILNYGHFDAGEQLQVGLSVDQTDDYTRYNSEYDHEHHNQGDFQENLDVVHLAIEHASDASFETVRVIKQMTSDQIFLTISTEAGYYRIVIHNLNDESIGVFGGLSDATLGQMVTIAIAAVMLGLAATSFGIAMSILWLVLIIAVILKINQTSNKPKHYHHYYQSNEEFTKTEQN
ncbi:MAG: hypothetical protein IH840_16325 [Candidatus Heimdallarchaeota archaeon]|nr:hypothetical protein [Candidatus Heimdallarchaeota archaeon]